MNNSSTIGVSKPDVSEDDNKPSFFSRFFKFFSPNESNGVKPNEPNGVKSNEPNGVIGGSKNKTPKKRTKGKKNRKTPKKQKKC